MRVIEGRKDVNTDDGVIRLPRNLVRAWPVLDDADAPGRRGAERPVRFRDDRVAGKL